MKRMIMVAMVAVLGGGIGMIGGCSDKPEEKASGEKAVASTRHEVASTRQEVPDPYPAPPTAGTRPAHGESVTTDSGLSYMFSQLGKGPWPQTGDTLVIHGIGKFTDGKEFWNTRTENKPYEYRLGVDRVIRGFSEGMQHVRQGDRIVITMKPELGYGGRGNRDIPPNSTLVFDYEILEIKPKPTTATAPR